jgi:hypothetical protein
MLTYRTETRKGLWPSRRSDLACLVGLVGLAGLAGERERDHGGTGRLTSARSPFHASQARVQAPAQLNGAFVLRFARIAGGNPG